VRLTSSIDDDITGFDYDSFRAQLGRAPSNADVPRSSRVIQSIHIAGVANVTVTEQPPIISNRILGAQLSSHHGDVDLVTPAEDYIKTVIM
jgi:hypothetical protein